VQLRATLVARLTFGERLHPFVSLRRVLRATSPVWRGLDHRLWITLSSLVVRSSEVPH
jgi:hypothetical protein